MDTPAWEPGDYIRTPEAAEEMAASAMRGLGFDDARCTPRGADGGIDVVARDAIAQVKFRGAQTSRADVQRLVGARGSRHGLRLAFFSASGFSAPAIRYADEMGVALFAYDPLGELTPLSAAAEEWSASREPARTTTVSASPLAMVAVLFWLAAVIVWLALWIGLAREPRLESWTDEFVKNTVIVAFGLTAAAIALTVGARSVHSDRDVSGLAHDSAS